MRPAALGIDSSTQSTKVELRCIETGVVLASASARHPATSPPVSEQEPDAWWTALQTAVLQLGDTRADIVAVSVAAQQHGLVLLDEGGEPIRPALLWNDTRSAPQAKRLVDSVGPDVFAKRIGGVPVASFTISKLAWIAEHEPENARKIAKIQLPHDYLTGRLTEGHTTDRGDASGTGWFDPVTNTYDEAILGLPDLPPLDWASALPEVLAPGAIAGTVQPGPAAQLGLKPGIPVAVGTGDNMGGALGLGLATGDVVISLGTSGAVYSPSSTPTHDPSGMVAGFADAGGQYLPLACTLNATRVTDTVATWLGTDARGLSKLAQQANVAMSEPVLLPWFDGERTPNLPNATGQFFGMTTSTTPAELALAAHTGVLCGLLEGVDQLRQLDVEVTGDLFLIGGGAKAESYQYRCADLWGSEIRVPESSEVVAAGAAVQAAAVATGAPHQEIAVRWGLRGGKRITPARNAPREEIRDRYRERAEWAAQFYDRNS